MSKAFARLLLFATLLAAPLVHAVERVPDASSEDTPAGAEWPSYNKTLEGQRYSPLTQINAGNADKLAEVCRLKVADTGSFQAGLLVIAGVMYATTATDTLAVDPTNCKTLWRHHYRRGEAAAFPVNRGVAFYAGRLFRGTDDGQVIALDARTGTELWANKIGDPAKGEFVSGAPMAWNGLVIVGTAASEFGLRGRVLAYEAMTGREVWRFNTVPAPGEANAETWRNTIWNDTGGGGGGTWSHFALDPSTAEVFIPVGNPIPDFVPAERPGDNLYTNSVLVLDALSGKLKWWYQLAPNDGLDHDLAAAPVLYLDSKKQARVAAGGKDGFLHIVDRRTHKLVAKTAVTSVDEPVRTPTPEGVKACPGPAGGVEWNGPAFNPKLNRLFVGSLDYCALFMSSPGTSKPEPGGYLMGGKWSGIGAPRGWIYALDADTGAVAWRYHADNAVLGGITTTAGGIVLGGDNAGTFLVFDGASGKVLKSVATGGSLSGGMITYQIGAKQYVAMTSGNISRSLFGASGRPNILIMALPDSAIAAESDGKPSATRGRELYLASCAVCHGADGNFWHPIDLRQVKSKMTYEQVVAFIHNPRSPMPKVFPEPVSPSEEAHIRDIATFIMQWQ